MEGSSAGIGDFDGGRKGREEKKRKVSLLIQPVNVNYLEVWD